MNYKLILELKKKPVKGDLLMYDGDGFVSVPESKYLLLIGANAKSIKELKEEIDELKSEVKYLKGEE